MILQSRYSKNLVLLKESENDILNFLLKNKDENKRKLIISCSDLAQYTIDHNYQKLFKYYYISGFKNNPGRVCELMDKYEQKKWADKHNILMAKTWKVNKDYKIKDITIPCIIKPCISAFGKKSDIKVCYSKDELLNTLNYYFENNYNEVLIQEFLDKEYELCALGCILENNQKYGKVIYKLREYPLNGGSTSYAKFTSDLSIVNRANKIIDCLIKEGYFGLYDIEIIYSNGKYYLNEINFRNSGNNYALLKSGIETPYLLYLEKFNKDLLKNLKIKDKDIYFMEDLSNFKSLCEKQISLWTFVKNFFRSKAHSVYSIKDLKVIIHYLKKR